MHSELFEVPIGQKQLSLDDFGIAEIKNLVRRMHQPRKLGAVIRPDRSIGITSHQIRTAPVWDPNKQVYKFLVHGHPDDMTWYLKCGAEYSEEALFCMNPLLLLMENLLE